MFRDKIHNLKLFVFVVYFNSILKCHPCYVKQIKMSLVEILVKEDTNGQLVSKLISSK